jgi:hypothetical protein
MKSVHILFALLLLSSVVLGQDNAPEPPASKSNAELATEVKALREALLETKKQVAAQQSEIESLRVQWKNAPENSATKELMPSASEKAAPLSAPTTTSAVADAEQQPVANQSREKRKSEESKLSSFKIGEAVLTLGGFVDLENIFRATNTQSNIATDFGAIPYSNTPQGNVSEFRTTAQFSRLNLEVQDHFAGNDITGYLEADFSGNDATSVYQTVNGHTARLRLYFADLKRGKWEFLGGQTWSWLTPNRDGIGPMPVDLAITYNEDQNVGLGLAYTRAAEFRAAYHPNAHWALGAGIEDPNQYIGNSVALPSAFASIGSQLDSGAQIGAANAFPDVLSKLTYDKTFAGRHFHGEVAGLLTGAHASVMPVGTGSFKTRSAVGGGGQIAANYELVPQKLVLLGNAFWSDGGAHYLWVTSGPELVIKPNSAGTDVSLSMMHAGAGSTGLEWRASTKDAFAVYYAADYFQRNFFPDTTDTAHPGTIIGYGGPGSPNTNNRALQQATFDWIRTFWRQPQYGALQAYVQYSYLTRAPWFVAPGDPKNAHLSMVYFGFRYILPSTAGTLMRVPRPD